MRTFAISGAIATMLVSSCAIAQDAQDFAANNPLVVILGGIFGGAPASNVEPPSGPRETQVGIVVPQGPTEQFTTQGNRDEHGYVQMMVKDEQFSLTPAHAALSRFSNRQSRIARDARWGRQHFQCRRFDGVAQGG
jgi:hypothetical protein